MQTKAKDYWKLFKPSACSLALKATTQEGVFEEIAANFVRAKLLPEELKGPAVQALIEREAIATTGVGHNVAIPHVKVEGLDTAVFSISLLPAGLEWSAVDGEGVMIFFTVLRPARAGTDFDPERHLEMMRWISQLIRQADFRRFVLDASRPGPGCTPDLVSSTPADGATEVDPTTSRCVWLRFDAYLGPEEIDAGDVTMTANGVLVDVDAAGSMNDASLLCVAPDDGFDYATEYVVSVFCDATVTFSTMTMP